MEKKPHNFNFYFIKINLDRSVRTKNKETIKLLEKQGESLQHNINRFLKNTESK